MFATIKSLDFYLNKQIEYFNINVQVLSGELDNPNGYSKDYILWIITEQVKTMHVTLNKIKEQSTNKKLIAKCEKNVAQVEEKFNSIKKK